MADEKKEATKPSPSREFKKQLLNSKDLQKTILEGLKSTSGRIRSLAVKTAFKSQEHPFIKQNVIPLIKLEKSKKVLRTLSEKMTRKELAKKVESLLAAKKTTEKTAANPEPATKPAEAPKA